jgi:hypothetical protein
LNRIGAAIRFLPLAETRNTPDLVRLMWSMGFFIPSPCLSAQVLSQKLAFAPSIDTMGKAA